MTHPLSYIFLVIMYVVSLHKDIEPMHPNLTLLITVISFSLFHSLLPSLSHSFIFMQSHLLFYMCTYVLYSYYSISSYCIIELNCNLLWLLLIVTKWLPFLIILNVGLIGYFCSLVMQRGLSVTLVHQRKDINDFESQKCSTYLSCGEREKKRERKNNKKREKERKCYVCQSQCSFFKKKIMKPLN